MGDCFVSDCFVEVTSDLAHVGVEPRAGLGTTKFDHAVRKQR